MRVRTILMCVGAVAAVSGVTACSDNSTANNVMNVDENLSTVDMNAVTSNVVSEPAPPVNAHNYDAKDGQFYEYVSAVSDEDAKKGKAAGDVSLLAYRGMSSGVYRISAVDDGGHSIFDYECTNPCAVIKEYQNGQIARRIGYNPAALLGLPLRTLSPVA